MEGRRVSRRAPKRNPLYVLFLCLVAAVFVLLIVTIVLGAKLSSANKQLEAAQTQIEQLQEAAKQEVQKPQDTAPEQQLPTTGAPEVKPEPEQEDPVVHQPAQEKKVIVDWLDLTGHDEVKVLPENLFNDYYTYYTTEGVNLRGGPSTSHSRITLVERGTKVKAAAKDGNWTFVSVGDKFGWVSSDYISTKAPAAAGTTTSGTASSGTSTGNTAEATSGSLKTQ